MAAEKNENSYRNILKGTSIFGGVQIFQILINLIRGKFVAMLLGPSGMGFSTMYTSASNTISQFASLGLNLAFVKEVAANKEKPSSLAHILYVAGIMIRLTALIGALACLVLSPMLSRWSFGTSDYTWQFVLLSVAVFLTVASMGQASLLQGMHKMKLLSLTSLTGAISGLVAGVPLYYFFGTRGIVPAMIVLSLTTWGFYTYGLRKATGRSRIRFDRATHLPMMRRMFSLGIILLAANLINSTCTYLINIFIRTHGDIADVGLFNAANSITLQYAGVVFTAMALDYFPRLTAAAGDMRRMSVIINRQMVTVALIATPLSILLVASAPIVIRLLLTTEFLPVTGLMRWLGISILLKAIAYPLGYITFANNNRRLFFWLEAVACNVLYIIPLYCFLLLFRTRRTGLRSRHRTGSLHPALSWGELQDLRVPSRPACADRDYAGCNAWSGRILHHIVRGNCPFLLPDIDGISGFGRQIIRHAALAYALQGLRTETPSTLRHSRIIGCRPYNSSR